MVGYGGTTKLNANIISNSTGSLEVNWQKTLNNCCTNLIINCPKYSGSSCHVNIPLLGINNIDKEDAGIYQLEVISPTETKTNSGICWSYMEVNICKVIVFCSVDTFPFFLAHFAKGNVRSCHHLESVVC